MPPFWPGVRRSCGTIGAAVTLVLGVLGAPGARAETLRYEIDFPDGESVAYAVPLEVRHVGRLSVRAEGAGRRTITLRLEPPKGPMGSVQRSGPPPIAIATTVETEADELGTWNLQIRGLAGNGALHATVLIELPELPDLPAPSALPLPTGAPAPVPQRPPAAWSPGLRRAAPPEHQAYLAAAARFADPIVAGPTDAPADACRWQSDLSLYLAARGEALRHGAYPSRPTREMLARIAHAVESVEALRTSTDPFVAGPPPDDPRLVTAWVRVRAERLVPLEEELDAILEALRRGWAPELEAAEWPARLVTCVTACERFFDERFRRGERHATNRELCESQWPRLGVAAEALAQLAALEPPATASAQP